MIRMMTFTLLLLVWLPGIDLQAAEERQDFHRHVEGVLGTSLDLRIQGLDDAVGEAAMDELLGEIMRMEALLSGYQDSSQVSQLNRAGHLDGASPEVLDVIAQCQYWQQESDGAFSCWLGRVMDEWRQAEQSQILPQRPMIRNMAWEAAQGSVAVSGEEVILSPSMALAADGLAKGYILERAAEYLEQVLQGQAFMLDIGGDAVYRGAMTVRGKTDGESWRTGLADPFATTENGEPLAELALSGDGRHWAVAASGHRARFHRIGRREYSHILQARDGWPVQDGNAAFVVAQDAITADAVATTLATLQMAEAIDWVNTLDAVEALVISPQGRQLSSLGWSKLLSSGLPVSGPSSATPLLHLSFTLTSFDTVDYRQPYVAVWISDSEGDAVKHLLLLGESERWARENSRWWRRVGRKDPQVLDGLARPTRAPGEYRVEWRGQDDQGSAVSEGEYVLHLEVAREHGGHDYFSVPFDYGTTPLTLDIPVTGELVQAQLDIRR